MSMKFNELDKINEQMGKMSECVCEFYANIYILFIFGQCTAYSRSHK